MPDGKSDKNGRRKTGSGYYRGTSGAAGVNVGKYYKGRELEIIRIGDHTADGIAILDRKGRLLFTGDEVMGHGKTLNGSVSKWKNDLEKLLAHRDEFDAVYGGPGKVADGELEIFYEAACKVMAGEEMEQPLPSEPHPPIVDERDADGNLIYDCQRPHGADVPKGGFFKVNPNMTDFVYKGYHFSYDKTLK